MGPWKRPREPWLRCCSELAAAYSQEADTMRSCTGGHAGTCPGTSTWDRYAGMTTGDPTLASRSAPNGVRYGSGATQRPHRAHSGWVQAEQVLVQGDVDVPRTGGLVLDLLSIRTRLGVGPSGHAGNRSGKLLQRTCERVSAVRDGGCLTDNVFQLQASGDRTVRPTLWRVGSPDEIALQACRQAWQIETSRRGSTRSPVRTPLTGERAETGVPIIVDTEDKHRWMLSDGRIRYAGCCGSPPHSRHGLGIVGTIDVLISLIAPYDRAFRQRIR